MRGEFLDLSGARIYYYAAGTRGAGDPVVFLHGFPTSGHLWSDVVPLMPAGHRIVVLDHLGYGRSDRPLSRPVDIRAHAERVVQVLDE
ncbi:MAG: alpha/beta fold hydrolase, partial [Gemmatimonadaceae bacterium]